MAAIWARYVRSADDREILFDLETARRDLFTREGKSNASFSQGTAQICSVCGRRIKLATTDLEALFWRCLLEITTIRVPRRPKIMPTRRW